MKKESSQILITPLVTEKASVFAEKNIYTFQVEQNSNKSNIAKAFKDLYKIEPVKVRVVSVKGKKIFYRGKFGKRSDFKKAYIYLKKGDKVEIL